MLVLSSRSEPAELMPKWPALSEQGESSVCPRVESNHNLLLRRQKSYPLNDRGDALRLFHFEIPRKHILPMENFP